MSAQAIVLVGHGAREPRWAVPLERLAAALSKQAGDVAVRPAYLGFMAPSLSEALAALYREGARKIRVVPVFLGAGSHVLRDIEDLVAAARTLYPALELSLEPPVGERREVTEAIASAIAS